MWSQGPQIFLQDLSVRDPSFGMTSDGFYGGSGWGRETQVVTGEGPKGKRTI